MTLALASPRFDPLKDRRHTTAAAAREVADWLAWLDVEGKSPRTLDSYERTAAIVLNAFPGHDLGAITENDLLHILKGFSSPQRRTRRAHIASLFGWAYRTGLIDRNPVDRMPKIKRHPKRVQPTFSDAEISLLVSLPSPDGALCAILLDTGIRKGEARRLQVKHVRLDEEVLVVRGKGDKDRQIDLTQRLNDTIRGLIRFERLDRADYLWYTTPGGYHRSHRKMVGEGSMHVWFDRCLELSGIEKAERHLHSTRHTLARCWLQRGGTLETLSETLGHESIKTTYDEYGHLDVEDIRRDLGKLEAVPW